MTLTSTVVRRLVLLLAACLVLSIAPAVSAQTSLVDAAKAPRRFTIDTNLRLPSGLSAWAIDRYLLTYTSLPAIGSAFKAAEQKHGVNARYLLAHAMLETAFGTSYFAQRYRNLFGWNAFDRDPSAFASRFRSYDAGIDHVAARISEWYLSPSGKYYGGAPTLRGMHMYASDPGWEAGIAYIANTMAIPTLAGREFDVTTPTLTGSLMVGAKSTATVKLRPSDDGSALPDGLRVAVRWRPVSIIEAGNPVKNAPDALPEFTLAAARTSKGTLKVAVVAPKIPGRYRLELQLRDSDGTPFGDGTRIVIPGAQVRVHASDAVTYGLEQTDEGVAIHLTNVGRKPVLALGADDASGTPTLSTLAVWSLPRSGAPALLIRIPLAADVPPGGHWTGVIPDAALAPALPGLILLRLEVAGAPKRFMTSPPGVFQLDVVAPPKEVAAPPVAAPSPTPTPAPTTDPSAASPAATTTDPAVDVPVVMPRVRIRAVTPADPASAVLLGTASGGTTAAATPTTPTVFANSPAAATTATRQVKAIRYEVSVTLLEGIGTVRLTNTGNITYHAVSSAETPSTASGVNTTVTQSALVISAVPATGTLDAPLTLRMPMLLDLAPGQSVDVPIALPGLPGVQPSFLVTVRLDTADPAERPTSAVPVFWMRGAPATDPADALVVVPAALASF